MMTLQTNNQLIDIVQKLSNIKLEDYKEDYILRRINYHMMKSKINNTNDYIRELKQNRDLVNTLIECLTVSVSSFFRDTKSFDFLESDILPLLSKESNCIRVWSVGCSIGAEIYSIALLLKYNQLLNKAELIASDKNEESLERAKKGVFYPHELKNLPKKYYSDFEEKTDKTWQINSNIMKQVSFIKHDLTNRVSLSGRVGMKKFNLIVCRNVTIYFNNNLKETLYEMFYRCLDNNGILFIGANETIPQAYQKKFRRIGQHFFMKAQD